MRFRLALKSLIGLQMSIHFVGNNYFGSTNLVLLHPMVVSIRDWLILTWICSLVEPPKYSLYI